MPPHATGHVRVIERKDGPVFYAKLRTADGRELMRRLGRSWTRRSKPPAGHLTRAQAEARLTDILAGRDEAVPVEASQGTFGAAIDEWLRYVEHDRKRRPTTLRDYRNVARQLVGHFGAVTPVERITTRDVERFREQLVAGGKVSDRTVNKSLVLLHGVFERAVVAWDLAANPVAKAGRQPHRRSGDIDVLDAAEVEQLAGHADDEQDAALFLVAAFTGLRMGELRALRWRDVDWSLQLIRVRRNRPANADEALPKSGKVRSVPLIDQAARAFDGLSRRGRFVQAEDYVFVNTVGDAVHHDTIRRRFHQARERAGLRRVRFHDLRHTFGTLAVQAFPLTDVKAYMGHADVSTTMVYVHFTPQHDAADKLSAIVAAKTGVATEDGSSPEPVRH